MRVPRWLDDTRASYDAVAVSYADQLRDALANEPFQRAILAHFAEWVRASGDGPVADVGCGPGRITGHLHGIGLHAFGMDLSPAMIDVARRDHPGLRFEVGSMTSAAGRRPRSPAGWKRPASLWRPTCSTGLLRASRAASSSPAGEKSPN